MFWLAAPIPSGTSLCWQFTGCTQILHGCCTGSVLIVLWWALKQARGVCLEVFFIWFYCFIIYFFCTKVHSLLKGGVGPSTLQCCSLYCWGMFREWVLPNHTNWAVWKIICAWVISVCVWAHSETRASWWWLAPAIDTLIPCTIQKFLFPIPNILQQRVVWFSRKWNFYCKSIAAICSKHGLKMSSYK